MKTILITLSAIALIACIIFDLKQDRWTDEAYFKYANQQSVLLRGYELTR
jgi:FtsZ-interacting cell division protein ZipA